MTWKLKGSDEDQAESMAFLVNAFGAAIFLIFAVLLAVFNRFTSVGADPVGDRAIDDRRLPRRA